MKHIHHTIGASFLTVTLIFASGLAQAKSVPGDGATPVVELMPLTMRYEADLKLSDTQINALADFRNQAMPVRLGTQNKIISLRGELRMAILGNKSVAEKEALMKQIADTEIEHFKQRDRCVDNLRKILSKEQFTQLSKLYLDGLR